MGLGSGLGRVGVRVRVRARARVVARARVRARVRVGANLWPLASLYMSGRGSMTRPMRDLSPAGSVEIPKARQTALLVCTMCTICLSVS